MAIVLLRSLIMKMLKRLKRSKKVWIYFKFVKKRNSEKSIISSKIHQLKLSNFSSQKLDKVLKKSLMILLYKNLIRSASED